MRFLLGFFLLSFSMQMHAQELWGVANSNYSGVMGHDLNPASVTGAPFKWELHLISTDVSLMNNYMYLRRNSQAIRRGVRGEAVEDDRFTDRFNTSDKSGYIFTFVRYPSLMYSTEKFGLSFHLSTRSALSATDVPYHLAKFMKEGFDYTPLQKTDFSASGARLAMIAWHEAGITAGKSLINVPGSYMTGGITLNYLYGLNSAFMNVNSISYNVQADSLWQIYMADVQYGHAAPGRNGEFGDYLQKRGQGFSASLGIQYYRNRNEAAYDVCQGQKKLKKYNYKIGLSLIDAGKITFDKQSYYFDFNNVSSDWYGIDTVKFDNLTDADLVFNNQFYGLPFAALEKRQYDIWLPTALSVQFDYAFNANIYINASWTGPLRLNEIQVRRPLQISLTPRYETKMFEVAIPYSYFDNFRHRLGVAVRYGIFTIGTDMLGPFTGLFDAYGMDIYAGIKLQHNPPCGKKNSNAGRKKGRSIDCFDDF